MTLNSAIAIITLLTTSSPLMAEFRVGFASADITPPVGWRRAGNYNELISTGVNDPLMTGSAALTGFATPLLGQETAPPAAPRKTVRVGFVGVGVKRTSHVGHLMCMEGVELRAVCDIVDLQCCETQEQAKRLGLRPPTIYSRGERDFEHMCAEEELDLVYTATPWEWHAPVCLAAMKNKHAATEIPATYTIEECWLLVETSAKTGRHLCMMENVNYMPDELIIYNMVRRGVNDELTVDGMKASKTRAK